MYKSLAHGGLLLTVFHEFIASSGDAQVELNASWKAADASWPDGAKTVVKVLVQTGLCLHSRDAALGLWKGLILLCTDPTQQLPGHVLAGFCCLLLSEMHGACSSCCEGLMCVTSRAALCAQLNCGSRVPCAAACAAWKMEQPPCSTTGCGKLACHSTVAGTSAAG